ncbi:nucleotidyltransferase family protein [Gracilimonas mengyeensis]|uniref:Nucleotidyltransferase domain-containing protein n=1 Tax=Gracilimonas mengyeensis TaxID=1302730 RepID=A0A521EB65_9BACT|nr:nucleotidyltransferase domain-containing protein [Gracilimonas mengyeensis]SMO81157.1 Nucleotidyltransferase domain-containing protein [Gracilimonas mengyeensis]
MNISNKHIRIIDQILNKHFPDARILVFGSRAAGTNSTFSDLDLAIEDRHNTLSSMDIADAKQDFIESDLPFSVDLVDLTKVDEIFKSIIKKEGREWEEIVSEHRAYQK